MTFKKCLWSIALACITLPAVALNVPTLDDAKTSSKALTEIQTMIQDMDLNYSQLNNKTIKVHFMITTKNEIVVLRTNDDDLDDRIKFGLNYKELKNQDLEVNKVYILPVSFKVENT